jgi:hypothetical protein
MLHVYVKRLANILCIGLLLLAALLAYWRSV